MMPNKQDELINKYREQYGRPPPSFDVSHLMDGHGDESGSNGADDTTMAVIDNHESHNDKSGNNECENNEIAVI